MLSRRDGIILGGTHEEDDWSLEPSETEMERVLSGHADFFAGMA